MVKTYQGSVRTQLVACLLYIVRDTEDEVSLSSSTSTLLAPPPPRTVEKICRRCVPKTADEKIFSCLE